ncbi:MAG: large-conductance mechanosensitive channel protein MscL [Alistipes sp.]|nr:large-conductance mechanosensitive channel protein MscL [Rikenellaceae bacterium]MBR2333405.1 large-conductance mechanosensitive channel protein MscL [Rikenellaceae bacterium]MBR2399827.1 large-conductance mechanosensitive channel protein MscL [Alistipes sp.]
MLKEFKDFAMRGNVVDMAVGVIIGGAFGKIVTSVVNDIIMPLIATLLGNVKFTDLNLVLKAADPAIEGSADITWNYGNFLQQVFDFMIIAIAIFAFIKLINMAKKKEEAKPAAPAPAPAPSKEEVLLTEIRDLLKEQNNK